MYRLAKTILRAQVSKRTLLSGIAAASLACAGFVPLAASAQDSAYPNSVITLVVPFAAGGGTDYQARTVARFLEPILGQNIVVENRPGAGGNIGARYVSTAKRDGYTLLVGSTGTHGTNEFLYSNLPYDPAKDFKPISVLAMFDNVVIVPESSELTDLKALVDTAKAKPGELNYGLTTIGSSSHLAIELLRQEAGMDMQPVPYNGSPAATADLLGGRLDVLLDLVSTQLGNLQADKVRPLAVTGQQRSPVLPDVPTVAESGYPGFNAIGWVGLFAPAGTPDAAIDTFYKALAKAFENPELRKDFESRGLTVAPITPKEYDEFLISERKKWSKLITDANIKIN